MKSLPDQTRSDRKTRARAVRRIGSALAAAWILAGLPSAAAADKAPFDLQARKASRPWLWQAPKEPSVPQVADRDWSGNPVDRFLRHRQEEAGLTPTGVVDDRAWLRRVTFVLTGLPPTADEIRTFLGDTAPGARERAVDRLLASPHFGERWARHWMDLMRYAETRGHESDYPIANAWHYRDYLVRAFNADLPYDRFLVEHLAGDLLPEPRFRPGTDVDESVVATGWAFLGEENHSPVDIRQDECERLDNKVDVFSKSFLGLTVSCARCHDHKFDPIRTDDYYGLVGYFLSSGFRQVRFEAAENNRRAADDLATLRSKALPAVARELGTVLRPAVDGLAGRLREAARPGVTNRWTPVLAAASADRADVLAGWVRLRSGAASADSPEAGPALPAGARVVADFTHPAAQPWKVDGEAFGRGPVAAGALLPSTTGGPGLRGVAAHGGALRDPFWNPLRNAPGNEDDSGRLGATSRAGRMLRTPTVTLGSGKLHYLVRGRLKAYAAVDSHIMLEGPLHGALTRTLDPGAATGPRWVSHDLSDYAGHRTHVEFGPDGDGEAEVLKVVESDTPPAPWPGDPLPSAVARAASPDAFLAAFGDAARRAADWLASGASGTPETGVATVADWLVRHARELGVEPESLASVRSLAAEEKALAGRVRWESRTAVSLHDGTGVDEFVLVRGKPSKPGASAPRGLPAAFAGVERIRPEDGSGRLDVARRLVAEDNPLTARVMVNRVWHHVFGRGLVATVDNFGALGEEPSHPELLDHLAWTFVHEDAWSVKRLLRRLVLTRAFALANGPVDPKAASADPANRLWTHRPVRRLEAEAIRDATLVVSGRFNPTLGGPPVPVYLDEFVVGRGRPDRSGPLDGDGRRSLYTAVRRNFLPPTQLAFDSPTPFSTVGRRNVTNVPAQALARMNDPFFRQQARVWAERIRRDPAGTGPENRISRMFEEAYGRLPTTQETADCVAALGEFAAFHGGDAGGVEAWTDLAHVLLNANEFIYVP